MKTRFIKRDRTHFGFKRSLSTALLICAIAVLGGCGGRCRTSAANNATATSSTGGTNASAFIAEIDVSGLASGGAVTLLDSGSSPLVLRANGAMSFPSTWLSNSAYAITIQSHSPAISCTLSNASGATGTTNVTVTLKCAKDTESVLWSFGGTASDGQYPYAVLTMDSAGNLFGTTHGGGANGRGTVFEIPQNASG